MGDARTKIKAGLAPRRGIGVARKRADLRSGTFDGGREIGRDSRERAKQGPGIDGTAQKPRKLVDGDADPIDSGLRFGQPRRDRRILDQAHDMPDNPLNFTRDARHRHEEQAAENDGPRDDKAPEDRRVDAHAASDFFDSAAGAGVDDGALPSLVAPPLRESVI